MARLLGATLNVQLGFLDRREDAGRLANDVSACGSPWDLVWVANREELNLLPINDEQVRLLVARNFARVATVCRVVLKEVRGLQHTSFGQNNS